MPTARIVPLEVEVPAVVVRNEQGIKCCYKIALISALVIFITLVISLVSYIYLASYIMETTEHPKLQAAHIQNVSVSFYEKDTLFLEANMRLNLSFMVPDKLKVDPKLATFALTTRVNNQTLIDVSTCKYNIPDIAHGIWLNFQVTTPEKKLQDQTVLWLRLSGDLNMLVKLARFPAFPKVYVHQHFVCDVGFRVAQLEKIGYQKCHVI
ncbi:hypothetical protein Hanom_Chr01g00001261 [Helianthus anomalus]